MIFVRGPVAFATAVVPSLPSQPRWARVGQIIRRICKSSEARQVQRLPIYTHVLRGWDKTDLHWIEPIWPQLDDKLVPRQDGSMAAWKIEWKREKEARKTAVDAGASTMGAGSSRGQNYQ